MLEEEGAKQNCCLPAWFCPSCEASLPKREGERKRKEGSVRRVKRGEEGWWNLEAQAGPYSLVGHLHHLLDGGVAGRHEVLCVLLHLDGLQPLRYCAEGHPLRAAGAGQPDGHPATGTTHLRVRGCSTQPSLGLRLLNLGNSPSCPVPQFSHLSNGKASQVGSGRQREHSVSLSVYSYCWPLPPMTTPPPIPT